MIQPNTQSDQIFIAEAAPLSARTAAEAGPWSRLVAVGAMAGTLLLAGCTGNREQYQPPLPPSASASPTPGAEGAPVSIPAGATIQVVKVEDDVKRLRRERTVDVEFAPNGATIDTTRKIGKYSMVVELPREKLGGYVIATGDKTPKVGDVVTTLTVANGTRDNDN